MIGVEKIDLGMDGNLKIIEYLMEIIMWKELLLSEPRIWILPAHLWSDLLERSWEKM